MAIKNRNSKFSTASEMMGQVFADLSSLSHQELLDLSNESQVPVSTIRNWMTGRIENAWIINFIPVAEALGYTITME